MDKVQSKINVGSLRISQEVIATITATAIKEIDGVHSLALFTSNIRGWLFKKQTSKSIAIDMNDDVATIDIHINIKPSTKVAVVAEQVQQSVKEAVQNMTGIAVSKVNVYISNVIYDEIASENKN